MDDGRFLLQILSESFSLLTFNLSIDQIGLSNDLHLDLIKLATHNGQNQKLGERYLGDAQSAVYLIRPDQYIAARWTEFDEVTIKGALSAALGQMV